MQPMIIKTDLKLAKFEIETRLEIAIEETQLRGKNDPENDDPWREWTARWIMDA